MNKILRFISKTILSLIMVMMIIKLDTILMLGYDDTISICSEYPDQSGTDSNY